MQFLAQAGSAARREAAAACMAATRVLGKLRDCRRGAAAVEYGFLVALIVIAIIVALTSFGKVNLDVWTNVSTKVTGAS